MGHFSNVLLVIDKVHTLSQRALVCGPVLGELNQLSRSNCPINKTTP